MPFKVRQKPWKEKKVSFNKLLTVEKKLGKSISKRVFLKAPCQKFVTHERLNNESTHFESVCDMEIIVMISWLCDLHWGQFFQRSSRNIMSWICSGKSKTVLQTFGLIINGDKRSRKYDHLHSNFTHHLLDPLGPYCKMWHWPFLDTHFNTNPLIPKKNSHKLEFGTNYCKWRHDQFWHRQEISNALNLSECRRFLHVPSIWP